MTTPDYITAIDAKVETPTNGGGYSTTDVTVQPTGVITKTVEVNMPVTATSYITIPVITNITKG